MKLFIIMNFLFVTAFIACITIAAIHFNKPALMWWYILPAFIEFCNVVAAYGGDKE